MDPKHGKSIGSPNVGQLVISYPFSFPSYKKGVEENENEVTKSVLNHFHRSKTISILRTF